MHTDTRFPLRSAPAETKLRQGSTLMQETYSAYFTALKRLGGRDLKKPMTIMVETEDHEEYLASFPEAHISIAGDSLRDAIFALQAELLASFDLYRREPRLSPELKHRLKVLESYIRQEGR